MSRPRGKTKKHAGLRMSLDGVYLDLFFRGYTVDHNEPPRIVPLSEVDEAALGRLTATMDKIRSRIEAVA